MTACRKEICREPNHPHQRSFRVIIDRAYMGNLHPEMRIDFYSAQDGTHYVRYLAAGEETVSLPVGHYRVVTFNDDSEFYTIKGDATCEGLLAQMPEISRSQYNNLYAGRVMSSADRSGAPAGGEDVQNTVRSATPPPATRTIGQPDDLFVGSVPDFEVTLDPQTQQDLYLLPRNQTVTYTILTDIQGLQYARQYRGTMTGVSAAKHLYSMELERAGSTMMFDCAKTSSTSISTVITAFGIYKADPATRRPEDTNIITFEFLLVDNSVYRQSFDIYDYLDETLCCEGGVIDLRGVPILIPATESTDGWNSALEDWYEQTVELE